VGDSGRCGPSIRTDDELLARLRHIDGRGYKAYKEIQGTFGFADFELIIDHVQGDPFAAPSRLRVRIDREVAGLGADPFQSAAGRTAFEDFLLRAFADAARRLSGGRRGTGKSGEIIVDRPGQQVIERTGCRVTDRTIEVRFFVGLPARGRRVLGRQAAAMLGDEIPAIVAESLDASALDTDALRRHVECVEDQDALRRALSDHGLIAFIADGSVLPRLSGIDERPLAGADVVPFSAPDALRRTLPTPHGGPVTGMGIPEGVTVVVGGGFHGKSTLLRAVLRGVYNHRPGDGRERVVARDDAVKIRSEDGRSIAGVDISAFLGDLPGKTNTRAFATENASGSSSQAAAIIEALEAGSRLLLMDEDSCATNFMIRDERMQRVVAPEREPITPLVDRIRELYERLDVSTVVVMGGSGDYLALADSVILMDHYRAELVTESAREVFNALPTARVSEATGRIDETAGRVVDPATIDPFRRPGRPKIDARDRRLVLGSDEIDVAALDALVSRSQLRGVGWALHYLKVNGLLDGNRTLAETLDLLDADLARSGPDLFFQRPPGDVVRPRRHEVAMVLNRLRTLRVLATRAPDASLKDSA